MNPSRRIYLNSKRRNINQTIKRLFIGTLLLVGSLGATVVTAQSATGTTSTLQQNQSSGGEPETGDQEGNDQEEDKGGDKGGDQGGPDNQSGGQSENEDDFQGEQ